MTPPREATSGQHQVVKINAGNTATTTTVPRGAVIAIVSLLLGGGGAVGGSALMSSAPKIAAMAAQQEDCDRRLRELEQDRIAASAERARMQAMLEDLIGRTGRVQSLLERHIERADGRGGR